MKCGLTKLDILKFHRANPLLKDLFKSAHPFSSFRMVSGAKCPQRSGLVVSSFPILSLQVSPELFNIHDGVESDPWDSLVMKNVYFKDYLWCYSTGNGHVDYLKRINYF